MVFVVFYKANAVLLCSEEQQMSKDSFEDTEKVTIYNVPVLIFLLSTFSPIVRRPVNSDRMVRAG